MMAPIAVTAGTLTLALGATLLWPPRPLLLWNSSASSPVGLYALSPSGRPHVGDTVIAWAPRGARLTASVRHYLPERVPLVKRVAAVSGDRVCAVRGAILVDGKVAARRRRRDPMGRRMPWWSGCVTLGRGELFLLSSNVPAAFDGRYFGVTRPTEVIGKARLVWRR
jgi:conjugative transfer signal peptidase TraF